MILVVVLDSLFIQYPEPEDDEEEDDEEEDDDEEDDDEGEDDADEEEEDDPEVGLFIPTFLNCIRFTSSMNTEIPSEVVLSKFNIMFSGVYMTSSLGVTVNLIVPLIDALSGINLSKVIVPDA